MRNNQHKSNLHIYIIKNNININRPPKESVLYIHKFLLCLSEVGFYRDMYLEKYKKQQYLFYYCSYFNFNKILI